MAFGIFGRAKSRVDLAWALSGAKILTSLDAKLNLLDVFSVWYSVLVSALMSVLISVLITDLICFGMRISSEFWRLWTFKDCFSCRSFVSTDWYSVFISYKPDRADGVTFLLDLGDVPFLFDLGERETFFVGVLTSYSSANVKLAALFLGNWLTVIF